MFFQYIFLYTIVSIFNVLYFIHIMFKSLGSVRLNVLESHKDCIYLIRFAVRVMLLNMTFANIRFAILIF